MPTSHKIAFHKLQATGNDFVVLDNRRLAVKGRKDFTRRACARRLGVGADGALFLERSRRADYKMRIFNPDGSEAEMCANGIRCIALYAHRVLGYGRSQTVETLAGAISVKVLRFDRAGREAVLKVGLPEPRDYRSLSRLMAGGQSFPFYFVEVGVPHAVIFREDLQRFPVERVAPLIRRHEHFKPRGTNVNFVKVTGHSRIRVRTFERGVEAETLACGTGSTASAIVSVLAGHCKPPVTVETQGGEELQISFDYDRFHVYNLSLAGKARGVFQGVLHV